MPFTPRPYQGIIRDFILDTPRCAIWSSMGTGKTASTLSAAEILALLEDGDPVLIIAPLRVATTTWPAEATKWGFAQVMPITGTVAQRQQALRWNGRFFAINYENIGWLIDHLGERWPFRTIICDEATKLKGFRLRQGTARARALAKVAHTKVNRFIELTGTPAPNGLLDLWGQVWFLDKGQRLGRTYSSFTERWFKVNFDGFGYSPLSHAQADIQAKLADICLTVDAKDWFDLREPIVNDIYVDLPPRARQHYDQMERDMFTEIETVGVEAFGAAARTVKCLQIANGAAYVDDQQNYKEVHDAKLQALDDIVEEAAGAPVLVAYHFKSDLARLQRAFPSGRVLDANPATITEWNQGRIGLLFAHPASAGHGLNLQDGGNTLVFFGHWWNLEERLQIIERIGPVRQLQAGHDRNVFIHNIIARDTVDELVIERIKTKREVQDILLDAMKQRSYA